MTVFGCWVQLHSLHFDFGCFVGIFLIFRNVKRFEGSERFCARFRNL